MLNPVVPAVVVGGVVYVLAEKSSMPPAPTGPGNGVGYSNSPLIGDYGQAQFGDLADDPEVRQKLDILQSSAQAAFNGLDAAGRATAAAAMNQALDLDPPLNGSDTWDTVVRVAAGAAGAAACNAIPGIGTAASPLCAIGAAYLGVKLEDWIGNGLSTLQSWASDTFGGIGSSIEDAYNGVAGWLDDIF